jgi:DNA-binding response OmpR family regulator
VAEYRILVVEDNPDTRELLCEQLEDERYEVMTAKDGQDAILRVGERAPDVVVMDVMMPHLDGFETSRYLKLRFRDCFIPILMLTAKSDEASREEGARYGCEDYRGKPYTRQQLIASVTSLIELGSLENKLLGPDAAELEEARRRVVELRIDLARRQLGERSVAIARAHLERVLELSPGHEGALTLLNQMGVSTPER